MVHGVAIKPGKPVILAVVDDCPVIGLPGYPVSAYIGFENFVIPVLSMLGDFTCRKNPVVDAVISKRLVSSLKHREYIRVKVGKVYLSSTHVGSMGGLMALKRREAHIAPVHLLDEDTGVYNQSYLKRIFKEPMALIRGVGRVQGLMVKKGNPMGICGIEDLKRCRYVNRQRGAGTRILLDYLLKKEQISPEEISGYDCEATTHMVGDESYDFALYQEDLELPLVKCFLQILKSERFHEKLRELGGYSWEEAGQIVRIDSRSMK